LDTNVITGAACLTASSFIPSGGGGSSLGAGAGSSTASTSSTLGVPNTGFGVRTVPFWQNLATYGLGATLLLTLAFVTRRAAKKTDL
jgi:hypothetical protein